MVCSGALRQTLFPGEGRGLAARRRELGPGLRRGAMYVGAKLP